MAAPTFGSVGTYLQGSVATASVAVPAGVVADDFVAVVLFINGATSLVTPAPGFVDAPSSPVVNTSGNAHRLHVLWKRATGPDSGTYDFVLSGTDFVSAGAIRYPGVTPSGSPWDATTSANSVDATSNQTPAVSVTTTGPDRMLLFAGSNWSGGGWTPPTGFNERIDNGFAVVTADDLAQAVAGSTGTVQATSAGNNRTVAWLGALLPVPPRTFTKAGGAVSAGAGTGARALQQPTGYAKSGGAAAPGAGTGASALLQPRGFAKSGGAASSGAAVGARTVQQPRTFTKAGGAVGIGVGGSIPFVVPDPVVDWPPAFTGPEAAPLVLFSGPEAAPLVLVSAAAPAPLVLLSGPEPAPSPGSTPHPMASRRGLARRSLPAPADEFVIEAFRQLRARRRADKIRKANS